MDGRMKEAGGHVFAETGLGSHAREGQWQWLEEASAPNSQCKGAGGASQRTPPTS